MSKNYTNPGVLHFVSLSLLAVAVAASVANGSLVGSVDFTDCLHDDNDMTCEEKKIVTLGVSYGLEENLEIVVLANDPCRQSLEEAVKVEITKSEPKLIYPLRFLHTVAYYPHEEVIKAPYPVEGCPGCIDCPQAQFPTCGWTYQGDIKLPHSQGFCIIKSLWELERSSWSCSLFRGEEVLGEQSTIDNAFSTGHKMLTGDVFFHGYEIGEYIKRYEIKIKMIQGYEEHTIKLRPDDPLYHTKHDANYGGNFNFKAELVGDMAPFSGALELDNYILYIPSSPDGHEMVLDYQNNMLLVPREEVSRDGSEPDKVGVSFKTFRSLGSNYKVSEAGDGLGNQLFHKHNFDLQKLAVNPKAETTYLVHGKKDFKGSMEFKAGMDKVLEHKITEINESLISLTLDKEAIVKNVQTESKGIILEGKVETFTSLTDEGVLYVMIKNIGSFKTNYIVTVIKATMNILKGIPAQARTLDPDGEATLKFDVSTVGNRDTSNEFLVSLRGPHGKLYDEVIVKFDTKKHASEYSWEKYEENKASESSVADVDMTAPEIIMYGPNTITLDCGDAYVELGAEAIDDTDPNVEVVIGGDAVGSSGCGIYEVTYSASDSSCNSAQITRTVVIQDNIAPVLTLNDPDPIVLACGDTYAEPGATATDECDGNVPVAIGGDTVDTSTPGEYFVTYDATDDSGNSAVQLIRTVTVQACNTNPPELSVSVSPEILWPPNHKMVHIICTVTATGNQGESPEVSLVSITMNEGEETNTYDPLFDTTSGDGNTIDDIQVFDDGSIYLRAERAGGGIGRVYTITYQAVDGAGNVTQTSATVIVPAKAP
ncbi:MAG: immunoglobulin-like domain-containing protein [Planctomycetota bacterium]|jgi:hypothetical protein